MYRYILFGTGLHAEKFYYNYRNILKIEFCMDNHTTGKFHHLAINTPRKMPGGGYYIIVACSFIRYNEMKEQLEDYGLKEFDDFIYYEFFNKKIAVIHANCFGSAYMEYLNKSKDFTDIYALYPIPPIYLNKKRVIDDNLLKHCDLLITQDIRKENPYGSKLSMDYISSRISKQCRIVVVPNLSKFGHAFFPYVKDKPIERNHGPVFWGNALIETYYQQGMNYEEIAERMLDINLYDDELIQKYFKMDTEKLQEREKKWDIIISDYILQNYQKFQLFYDQTHPVNSLLEEIGKRILIYLGFNLKHDIFLEQYFVNEEIPILPSVKKALGMNWEDRGKMRVKDRDSYALVSAGMDIKEYVKEFIYFYYE